MTPEISELVRELEEFQANEPGFPQIFTRAAAALRRLSEQRDEASAAYDGLMKAKETFRAEAHRNGERANLAEARLAELSERAAHGWQPIETADKDHNVLVAHDGQVSEAYYDGENDAWYKAGKSPHDFDFVSSDLIFPTHWMPLPALPVVVSEMTEASNG